MRHDARYPHEPFWHRPFIAGCQSCGVFVGRPAIAARLFFYHTHAARIWDGCLRCAQRYRYRLCLIPAYIGLLPAYGVLWLTGVGLAGRQRYAQPLLALSASVIGVGLAFIISNAFWYALSGKFVALNLIEFSLRVVKYFPPYLGSAMLYLAPALIAGGFWRKARVVA